MVIHELGCQSIKQRGDRLYFHMLGVGFVSLFLDPGSVDVSSPDAQNLAIPSTPL